MSTNELASAGDILRGVGVYSVVLLVSAMTIGRFLRYRNGDRR